MFGNRTQIAMTKDSPCADVPFRESLVDKLPHQAHNSILQSHHISEICVLARGFKILDVRKVNSPLAFSIG